MAARAQLVEEHIKPALAKGLTVICDRFLLANVVYQGSAGGMNVDELWSIGRVATGGLAPDVTIVLDLEAHLALQRLGATQDRLEKRGLGYFQAVRQGFLDQCVKAGRRTLVADASQSIERVHQKILAFLDEP
jgi:dTMP kinase